MAPSIHRVWKILLTEKEWEGTLFQSFQRTKENILVGSFHRKSGGTLQHSLESWGRMVRSEDRFKRRETRGARLEGRGMIGQKRQARCEAARCKARSAKHAAFRFL